MYLFVYIYIYVYIDMLYIFPFVAKQCQTIQGYPRLTHLACAYSNSKSGWEVPVSVFIAYMWQWGYKPIENWTFTFVKDNCWKPSINIYNFS